MQITIFAKKRNTKEGKVFFTYLTKLTKKDGTEVTASAKFRDECGSPKPDKCPMNILLEKVDCNFNSKATTDEETGEIRTSNTLWINNWKEGEPYVDHSMDDFV